MTLGGIILFSLCGGWISRMCGGGPPKLPWGIDQWLYAAPFALMGFPAAGIISAWCGFKLCWTKNIESEGFGFELLLLVLCFASVFLGKRTGHGNGISLGRSPKGDDEPFELFIKGLHGKIPEYWYDVLLLSFTGFMTVLIPAVVVAPFNLFAAALLILSGLLKGPAYMIGWAIYPEGSGRGIPHLSEATAVGEFLTGFFGWGGLALTAILIFGGAV